MIKFLENLKKFEFEYEPDPRLAKWHLGFVNFADLYITEQQAKTFSADHVRDILENFHPALLRPTCVVHIDGKLVCWDGQHSAVVALLKGMEQCPCVIFESDDWEFKKVPTIEKFDPQQILDLYHSMSDTQK
jgi:hypothetical protein